MKHEKLAWVKLVLLMCLKECCFSDSTSRTAFTEENEGTIINNVTNTPTTLLNSSDTLLTARTESAHSESLDIFRAVSNDTRNHPNVTENILRVSEGNTTKVDYQFTVLSSNDTFKTNYTLSSEAIASQEDSSFWVESTGAIAAGVFLISAVVGYFSCVGYRRFMQKKYGNSQIVAGEDVYDTSDLRYFEI